MLLACKHEWKRKRRKAVGEGERKGVEGRGRERSGRGGEGQGEEGKGDGRWEMGKSNVEGTPFVSVIVFGSLNLGAVKPNPNPDPNPDPYPNPDPDLGAVHQHHPCRRHRVAFGVGSDFQRDLDG